MRFGDKHEKYIVGDNVEITLEHMERLKRTTITYITVKKVGDIQGSDLDGESSDSATKDLLVNHLNETYSGKLNRRIEEGDIVTIIKWVYGK